MTTERVATDQRLFQFTPSPIPSFSSLLKRFPLSESDYKSLESRAISSGLATAVGLFRVDDQGGAEVVGRRIQYDTKYSGFVIPWTDLADPTKIVSYQLRRDTPDIERKADGREREVRKYMFAPGARNGLYVPPVVPREWLQDTSVKIVLTEGALKALALVEVARQTNRRFMPVALSGVWNWRGVVGKTTDEDGGSRAVKGVIPDFDRIEWQGREVVIVFDADLKRNEDVGAARWQLMKELINRGAIVKFAAEWDELDGKGIDDFFARRGAAAVIEIIEGGVTPLGRRDAPPLPEASKDTREFFTWCADTISALTVPMGLPPSLRGEIDAIVGAAIDATPDREGWYSLPMYQIGSRLMGECHPAAGRTESENDRYRDAVKKTARRALERIEIWQRETGFRLIEWIKGDMIRGQKIPTKFRLYVLDAAAAVLDDARRSERWSKSNQRKRTLRYAAARHIDSLRGEMQPTARLSRKPQADVLAKIRKLPARVDKLVAEMAEGWNIADEPVRSELRAAIGRVLPFVQEAKPAQRDLEAPDRNWKSSATPVPMVPHGENHSMSEIKDDQSVISFQDQLRAAQNTFEALSETERRQRGPEFWAAAMKLLEQIAPYAETEGKAGESQSECHLPVVGDDFIPEVFQPIQHGTVELTDAVALSGDENVPVRSSQVVENKMPDSDSETIPDDPDDAFSIKDADELILRVARKWADDGTLNRLPRKIDLVDMVWNFPAEGIRTSLESFGSEIAVNRRKAILHLKEIIPDLAVWLALRNLEDTPFAA